MINQEQGRMAGLHYNQANAMDSNQVPERPDKYHIHIRISISFKNLFHN